MSYKLVTSELLGAYQYIEYTDENGIVWNIPIEEANSDYQAYLVWLEENK